MERNLNFVGIDWWHRDLFQDEDTKEVFVDVDGELHSLSGTWGEPVDPIGTKTPEVTPQMRRGLIASIREAHGS